MSAASNSGAERLDVLPLLTHLLDQYLHVDRRARGLDVLRLGGQGIRLTIQLLHEEVEAPTRGLLAGERLAPLGDVTAQPVEPLVDVEALGENGELLLQPLVIDVGGELSDAVEKLRAHPRTHFRQTLRHAARKLREPVATQLERLAQPAALAVAETREIDQRFAEQRLRGRDEHG